MGLYRTPEGQTVEIEDDLYARDLGYTPITAQERLVDLANETKKPDGEGILGGINAAASSFVSGATLGASDVVLGSLMTGAERERMRQHREAHDVISGVANVAGAVAPALLSGGSSLPSGMVSRQAARMTAAGAELGGAGRVAGAITGGAYEGAAQMAGAYLSDVALGNRELSAEGFVGSLKAGALLGGTVGGGASLLESGAARAWTSARKLFPAHEATDDLTRAAESKFADELDQVLADSEVIEQTAKQKLEELRLQRMANDAATREHMNALRVAQAEARVAAQKEIAAAKAAQREAAELRLAKAKEKAQAGPKPRKSTKGQEPPAEQLGGEGVRQAPAADVPVATAPETNTAPAAGAGAEGASTLPSAADDVNDPLLAQLRATQRELDAGADLGKLSRGERVLEDAADDTVIRATEDEVNRRVDDFIAAGDAEFRRVRDAADNLATARARLDAWMAKYGKGGQVGRFERTQAARDYADRLRPTDSGYYTHVPAGEGNVILRRGREMRWRGSEAELEAAEREVVERYATSRTLEEHIADGSKVRLAPGTTEQDIAEISRLQGRERAIAAENLAARGRPPEQAIREQVVRAAREQAATADAPVATTAQAAAADAPVASAAQAAGDAPVAPGPVPASVEAAAAIPPGVGRIAAENIEDIAEAVEVIGQYERAVAEAMDVVTPPAPVPAATRSAEGMREAMRKHGAAQATQATEAAEGAASALATPEGRAAVEAARMSEDTARAAQTIMLPGREAAEGAVASGRSRLASQAADLGGVLEVLNTLGVPGMPRPSDIPLIGPLLGMFLQARAAATVFRRLGGKIPETAETRIASAAATTRTRAVQAVRRAIELGTKAGRAAAKVGKAAAIPSATQILSRKLLADADDRPEETRPRGPSPVERRLVELAAYRTNRDAYLAQVRRSLPTRDPSVAQAVADVVDRKMSYLERIAPKDPRPPMLVKTPWVVPPGQVESFARSVRAVEDPMSVFDDLERGVCTPEAADALRTVYPQLYAEAQRALVTQAPEMLESLTYAVRTNLAALFGVDLDATHTPQYLAWISTAPGAVSASAATSQPGTQPAPGTPPQPGIVADVSLSQSMQSSTDRRAMR